MILNRINNTAIQNKSYLSRGLIAHGIVTDNCVRGSDGTLWAAVMSSDLRGRIELYRSTDRGFSWNVFWKGDTPTGAGWGTEDFLPAGMRSNGAIMSVNLYERINRLFIWVAFRYTAVPENRIWPLIIDLETGTEDPDDEVPSNTPTYQVAADDINIKTCYTDDKIFLTYVKGGALEIMELAPYRPTVERDTSTSTQTNYLGTYDLNAREDNTVDIVIATSAEAVAYTKFDSSDGTYSTPVTIASAGDYIQDINIERDGDGDLFAAWMDQGTVHYAISTDDGSTWSASTISAGAVYVDNIKSESARRINVLAGLSGFMITYVSTRNGNTRAYVRTIIDSVVGDEYEIATISNPNKDVVGAKFFNTPAQQLMDISSPGQVRMAYQVGEGNSASGDDTVAVRFGQELLSESAYSEPFDIEDTPPVVDVPIAHQRLVSITVLPGPSQNIDYHEQGAKGPNSARSKSAFEQLGTPVRILRYEPTTDSQVNDRSAYGEPTEQVVKAIMTPMSYEAPFAATQDSFTTFIERDARRIHLPPDFHPERTFVLNDGNFLKRTVWTVLYDGNEYEISQVVPYFVENQITHYSANAFVVGPSNDPFSRKTLPSET